MTRKSRVHARTDHRVMIVFADYGHLLATSGSILCRYCHATKHLGSISVLPFLYPQTRVDSQHRRARATFVSLSPSLSYRLSLSFSLLLSHRRYVAVRRSNVIRRHPSRSSSSSSSSCRLLLFTRIVLYCSNDTSTGHMPLLLLSATWSKYSLSLSESHTSAMQDYPCGSICTL